MKNRLLEDKNSPYSLHILQLRSTKELCLFIGRKIEDCQGTCLSSNAILIKKILSFHLESMAVDPTPN